MLHDVAATRGTTNKHSYWLDRTQSSPRPESCTAMPLTLCLEPCFYPGDVGWLHFLRSAADGGGLGSSERERTENSRTKRGAYPPTAHYTCCSSFCCGKAKTESQQVQEHSSWISMLDITFLLLKCPQFSTSLTSSNTFECPSYRLTCFSWSNYIHTCFISLISGSIRQQQGATNKHHVFILTKNTTDTHSAWTALIGMFLQ